MTDYQEVLEAARQDKILVAHKSGGHGSMVKGVVTANQALAHNQDQVIIFDSVKKFRVFGDQQSYRKL